MARGVRHMDLGLGLGGWALNGAVSFGAGAGIGFAYGKYRDKWIGKHSPKLAAGLGKLGGGILVALGANPIASGIVDSLGQAGLTMLGAEVGLEQGRKSAGTQAVLMPASAALPAGATRITKIGELPPADPGDGLSLEQLRVLSGMH